MMDYRTLRLDIVRQEKHVIVEHDAHPPYAIRMREDYWRKNWYAAMTTSLQKTFREKNATHVEVFFPEKQREAPLTAFEVVVEEGRLQ